MEAEVAAARKEDPEWYNEDANFLAAVQGVLDAKTLVLGPAKLEWIAGLEVEEAEQHAPLVLESAKSGDEHKVRAAERLGECTGLQMLNLHGCSGLTSLPNKL